VARRAIKSDRAPVSSTPRAKSIAPADRALDQYSVASRDFDALCDDHGGLGGIDLRYAEMASAAARVITTLLTQPRAPASGYPSEVLQELLNDYAVGRLRTGDRPEDDIRVAEIALRELNGRRSVS
jgi:hypothetical protein